MKIAGYLFAFALFLIACYFLWGFRDVMFGVNYH